MSNSGSGFRLSRELSRPLARELKDKLATRINGNGHSTRWITDTLPDDEIVVLMRLSDKEYPVWPGFHEDQEWRSADGSTVSGPVLGWMHLEEAAKILGGAP